MEFLAVVLAIVGIWTLVRFRQQDVDAWGGCAGPMAWIFGLLFLLGLLASGGLALEGDGFTRRVERSTQTLHQWDMDVRRYNRQHFDGQR